jgi:transposase
VEQLKTGDGSPLPGNLKAQIRRVLDRLELLLIYQGCRDRAVCSWLGAIPIGPGPLPILLGLRGVGPEFAAVLEGLCDT